MILEEFASGWGVFTTVGSAIHLTLLFNSEGRSMFVAQSSNKHQSLVFEGNVHKRIYSKGRPCGLSNYKSWNGENTVEITWSSSEITWSSSR